MTSRYDYLPYFYSRVFEYEGSQRKIWWQFFGDNGTNVLSVSFLPHDGTSYNTFCFVFCILFIAYLAVGETIEVGNFDPKIATFWIDSGTTIFFTACCLIYIVYVVC